MADLAYNRGLDELAAWASGTYRFLLLKGAGYIPDRDHDFVSELTPGSNEVTVAGYSRQTAGTKVRAVDYSSNRITYKCADPAFGVLAAGETVSGMVLYRFVTNDADSILIGYFDLVDTPTSGAAFPVVLNAVGVAYVNQGA